MHLESAGEVYPLMALDDRQADDDGRFVQKTVNSHRLCDRPSGILDKDELVRIRKIPGENRHAALRELVQDAQSPQHAFRLYGRAQSGPRRVKEAGLTHAGALQLGGHRQDEFGGGRHRIGLRHNVVAAKHHLAAQLCQRIQPSQGFDPCTQHGAQIFAFHDDEQGFASGDKRIGRCRLPRARCEATPPLECCRCRREGAGTQAKKAPAIEQPGMDESLMTPLLPLDWHPASGRRSRRQPSKAIRSRPPRRA